MISAWVAARRSDLSTPEPILIARTNSQVLALNAGVREALRGEGRLGAEDAVSLTAVTASGREHQLGLAVGDRLRFLARMDSVGAINGTEAILTGIERDTEGLRLRARIGAREVSFVPEALADARGRVRLGHAYATTCFGAQGLTTDAALVWVDAGFDRHDAFVAASRARETTRLFVDCIGFDAAVRKDRSLSERGRPVTSDERQAALARVLGRSGEKASTLDYGARTAEPQDQLDLSRSDGGRASPSNTLSMPAKTAGQPRRDRQRGKGLALDG
ncbi:hypothetical protein CTI14_01290 [Methylobacterium radiotolerans]|nr:hypothetical protein CTI14_01290 [Methylobacterium radiotolerans]